MNPTHTLTCMPDTGLYLGTALMLWLVSLNRRLLILYMKLTCSRDMRQMVHNYKIYEAAHVADRVGIVYRLGIGLSLTLNLALILNPNS